MMFSFPQFQMYNLTSCHAGRRNVTCKQQCKNKLHCDYLILLNVQPKAECRKL